MVQNRQTSDRRAFTLVELLVVISIIGLLVAILVPFLSRARHQVQSVVCRSNMKQLMNGMLLYVTDYEVLPGTHSLFYLQSLFSSAWPRPAGSTWDGARDRIVELSVPPAYSQPYHLDPEFLTDVPGKGTVFPYLKDERIYTCPADQPGEARNTPQGGGGNGRLSYSLNAHVGYQPPDHLRGFTFVADSPDNPLPGGRERRSFQAGQRVTFSAGRFMTLFEEHPSFHINSGFPDGSFNELDRIATRHMPSVGAQGKRVKGRVGIAFLDGHAESPVYPAMTDGRELFTTFGQPYYWRQNAAPDRANMAAFIRDLKGPSPW